MTDWTPQTRQNKVSGVSHKYEDTTISGFMGTHQPAIWMGDYGYITIMPQIGPLKLSPDERSLPLSHAEETTHPYEYAVSMATPDHKKLHAEMTATDRCAYMRFQFPKSDLGRVIIEMSRPGTPGGVKIDAQNNEVSGFNPDRMDRRLGPFALPHFRGYFVISVSRAVSSRPKLWNKRSGGSWSLRRVS